MAEDRNQRAAETLAGAYEALDRADQALAQPAPDADGSAWHQARTAAPPRPAPPQHSAAAARRDWQAEQRWIEQIIDAKLDRFGEALCAGIGEVTGDLAKEERLRLEGKIDAAKAELASTTLALLAELEHRLDLSERAIAVLAGQRATPARPRLVVSDDDAA